MKLNKFERIPIWIWIDPTRKCNLSCKLCYTKLSHASLDLESDSLTTILDSISNSNLIEPQELTFNWRGEPLMNRQLHVLLRQISSSRLTCPVQFHTNAMLITDRRATELIEAYENLTIYVSIDGGTEESHDRNRGKGTFMQSIKGVENLLRARASRSWPKIVLYQLDLKEEKKNYDPAFIALIERLDGWLITTPVLPDGDGGPFVKADVKKGGASIVDCWSELPRDYPLPQGPCFFAGNALVIGPDGFVSICILSNETSGVIGNVLTESLDVIISRAQSWRKKLTSEGRSSVEHCANCRKCEGVGNPKINGQPGLDEILD